jgi:GDPmannose 4,6-dehydratase
MVWFGESQSSIPNLGLWRIRHILGDVELHAASLESYPSIFRVMGVVRPEEIYHLAAQSFVSYSFEDEFSALNTNINGTHYMLASAREVVPGARFYFAGSSEIIGEANVTLQNENTPFHPRSAYGISKAAGFELTRNYREAYQLHASSGILFNHESPRPGFEFVTRKITSHAAKAKLGLSKELRLGNLDAQRDWGDAREYVRAMWLMLQQEAADDYVIATGETHSVREFLDIAFRHVGLNYQDYLVIDPQLYRAAEVTLLLGDCRKAKERLGWVYSHSFLDLVHEMVETDLRYYDRSVSLVEKDAPPALE